MVFGARLAIFAALLLQAGAADATTACDGEDQETCSLLQSKSAQKHAVDALANQSDVPYAITKDDLTSVEARGGDCYLLFRLITIKEYDCVSISGITEYYCKEGRFVMCGSNTCHNGQKPDPCADPPAPTTTTLPPVTTAEPTTTTTECVRIGGDCTVKTCCNPTSRTGLMCIKGRCYHRLSE